VPIRPKINTTTLPVSPDAAQISGATPSVQRGKIEPYCFIGSDFRNL
jgi:hypothetical protein